MKLRTFKQAENFLYSQIPSMEKRKFPGEIGLKRTKYLMKLLGNPQEKVKVIHLNDSKGAFDSGIDRHEHIGKGTIGIECFRELMQHSRFKQYSMILETPIDETLDDKKNLDLLRSLRNHTQ